MELYLSVESDTNVVSAPISGDSWDRGSTSTSWRFGDISISKPSGDYRTITVDFEVKKGQQLHMVVAVWSDGDSFGHDHGKRCDVMSAHIIERRAFRAKECLTKGQKKLPDGYSVTYIPWKGMFESLDYITVVSGIIGK